MEAEKYLVRTRALRSQRDVWKQAAVGVLALSITGNIGLYAVGWAREARHQEESRQLRAELQHVEAVRDSALEELGRLANQTAREAQARREQAEAYEAIGAYQAMYKRHETAGHAVHKDGVWHCPDCNRRVHPHHAFCRSCGKKLDGGTPGKGGQRHG